MSETGHILWRSTWPISVFTEKKADIMSSETLLLHLESRQLHTEL